MGVLLLRDILRLPGCPDGFACFVPTRRSLGRNDCFPFGLCLGILPNKVEICKSPAVAAP